jgi:ribokinase
MTGRVIAVGAVNVDLVIRSARLPGPGETVVGGSFERHQGGKAANQAVAAARLGVSAAFVGAVGDDEFGRLARTALLTEGVDLSGMFDRPGDTTGVALILVDREGENLISVASGANGNLSTDAVGDGLGALDPVSSDVILVSCEIPAQAVRRSLEVAREAGATSILNPAPATGLDRSVFGLADILTPNRVELAALASSEGERIGRPFAADHDPARAAAGLLKSNAEGGGVARAVIVTLGPSGALVVLADGSMEDVPAPRVHALDSTGAGDALNGTLAAGLAEGRLLPEAVRRAVAAASLATTAVGAREGMPSGEQLTEFLRSIESTGS